MIDEFNSKDNQLLRCKNEIYKIIKPFEQKAISTQSDSQSEEDNSKKNTFNNIGENIYRRDDNQKWYNVLPNQNQEVNKPEKSKWVTQQSKEMR